MPKTNDAALDAFIAAKNEIDAMMGRGWWRTVPTTSDTAPRT